LYERVLGLEGATFGMNAKQRISALGLQDIISAGAQNVQMDRQSAAALLVRLYAGMHGLGGGNIAVAGRRAIFDAQDIDASRRNAVGFCLEKGLLKLANGRFEPLRPVTRAELINVFAAMPG